MQESMQFTFRPRDTNTKIYVSKCPTTPFSFPHQKQRKYTHNNVNESRKQTSQKNSVKCSAMGPKLKHENAHRLKKSCCHKFIAMTYSKVRSNN